MSGCWQALCYTGRGFDTCWRPGHIAKNIHTAKAVVVIGLTVGSAPFTAIRRITA